MDRRSATDRPRALATVLLAASCAALLLCACGGSGSASSSSTPAGRWEIASSIADSLQEGGAPRPVAECAGERTLAASSSDQVARLESDPTYGEERGRAARLECERSYRPSGAPQPTAPIEIDPQASPEMFAAGVDEICAVDYDEADRREEEIESLADARHWSDGRAEVVLHDNWAASQAETARLVTNLGTPPSRAALVKRWRDNVAERGRLYHADGEAIRRGDTERSEQIWGRILALKEKADRYGRAIGLQVCTSN